MSRKVDVRLPGLKLPWREAGPPSVSGALKWRRLGVQLVTREQPSADRKDREELVEALLGKLMEVSSANTRRFTQSVLIVVFANVNSHTNPSTCSLQ